MRCGQTSGCTAEAVAGHLWPGQKRPTPACSAHQEWARRLAGVLGFVLHEVGVDVIDAQAAEEVRGMLERERMAEKARNFGFAYGGLDAGVSAMQARGPHTLGPPLTEAQVRASKDAVDTADMVVRIVRNR